ncbi:MAG: hypothetical protein HY903_03455 [Deltaproteobacteria bacterium]|nr:hypothetical protein [Deltaproteobacteria bacterium]
MRKTLGLIVSALLVTGLAACEDAACKKELEAAKASATTMQTEMDALKTKAGQVDGLTAKVQTLTQEIETMKAAAAAAPAKPAPAKGKKK